jgi:hypothetical protein
MNNFFAESMFCSVLEAMFISISEPIHALFLLAYDI